MLAQFLIFCSTSVPSGIRKLGHVGYSVALWSRARRCRKAWAPHEARCHDVVQSAMADLPRRRTAVVLGSGLVRDVPLEALDAAFQRIVLVDAVHLWPVRRRLAGRPGIELVTADLSGAVDMMLGRSQTRADPLAAFRDDPEVDLVISANLLSQLPLAPDRWLSRPSRGRPDLPRDFADGLVGAHIADLKGLKARVCLLTDVELREVGRDGAVLDRYDLLRGHTLPEPDQTWDWTVAPLGEVSRRYACIHRVHGYSDLAAAVARHTVEPAPRNRE